MFSFMLVHTNAKNATRYVQERSVAYFMSSIRGIAAGLMAGSILGMVGTVVAMPYVKPMMRKGMRKGRRALQEILCKF